MPFYEFECLEHGRFTVRQPMFAEHTANCPNCGMLAERRFSFNFRFAEPITLYQDLGRDSKGNHKGYQVQGWKADSGISHKPGEPYNTSREVQVGAEISKHEAYKLGKEK